MRFVIRGRSARPWTGVLLTLLVGGLSWPSGAWAGCGSHVIVVGSDPAPGAAGFDPRSLGEPRSSDRTPPAPTDRPGPCAGALCSDHPGIPAPPAPAPPDRVENWAWLDPTQKPDSPDFLPTPSDEGGLASLHRGLSIFRPPRPPLAAPMD